MKQILINKRIGPSFFEDGIQADSIRDQLDAVPLGEDIRIVIDSGGGSIWECVAIFNVIRDYVRSHTSQKVETYIQGMAASAASVIALAAKSANKKNKIIVEDNSIFMIHNAHVVAFGDHVIFEKEVENLKKMDALMARSYCAISGKSDKEVHKLMDDETFFYGEEITAAGFADDIAQSSDSVANPAAVASWKDANIANAKAECENIRLKLNYEKEQAAFNRIAACLTTEVPAGGQTTAEKNNTNPTAAVVGNETEDCMTVEELKAKNPDVYTAVLEQGVAAGEKKERERCSAHLKMGELAGSLETAAQFIRDGSGIASNDVQTAYFEKRIASQAQANRSADNTPALKTPEANQKDGMVEALKQFDAVLGGGN